MGIIVILLLLLFGCVAFFYYQLTTFPLCLDVSSKSFSLKQHLPYILSNWLISDDWANFPYYFFKSESLKKFFVDHVNEAMPVLLINCLCNKRKLDAVFNLFEDVNLLNILPAFVGAFLACAYSHGKNHFCIICCFFYSNWFAVSSVNSIICLKYVDVM